MNIFPDLSIFISHLFRSNILIVLFILLLQIRMANGSTNGAKPLWDNGIWLSDNLISSETCRKNMILHNFFFTDVGTYQE